MRKQEGASFGRRGSGCGSWTGPWSWGFNFWPHCTAFKILVPWPQIEPGPQKWEHWVLTTGLPGKSWSWGFLRGRTCSVAKFVSDSLWPHGLQHATPWTAAHQASLSLTASRSLLKLLCIESVMPFSHLILCHTLFLLPSIFPSIRVFSNESALQRTNG